MSNKQTSCVAIVDFLADVSELISPDIVKHFETIGEQQALGVLVHSLHIVHDRVAVARVTAQGRIN